LTVVCTLKNEIILLNNFKDEIATIKTEKSPMSCALSPTGTELAVGFDDATTKFYAITDSGKSIKETNSVCGNKGEVTAIDYSPDGVFVAVSDSQRNVIVYDCATKEVKFNEWIFHTSRVNSIKWSLDSKRAVSGSVDASVEVWNIENPMKHICIKGESILTK